MMGVRPRYRASLGSDPATGRLKVACLLLFFCAACGPSGGTQISQSGAGAFDASLASTDDGFAVAWYDRRDGNAEIYLRLLNAMGEPAGPERRLTSSPELSYTADIQPAGTNVAVAWYEEAGGYFFSTAIRCRECRVNERERIADARLRAGHTKDRDRS